MIELCLLFFSLEPQPLCDLCRGFYRVWVYGGYSGDLSPQLTLELLAGKEDAILIDVRPEVLRERDGIPDLRRAARFRYAIVTLPEVDGPVRKLLKGGRDLDDILTAVVIRNLKAVQRPYLVQGGFQSWVKQGIQAKELKPETVLTILNEEAEAILEDIRPSPVQTLGYGVGFAAASYALLEWEKHYNLLPSLASVRCFLSPVRLGVQAFSWATGKLENNRIGLPTSPSSSDVQNRVLQAAAKHESQPSETEVG